MPPRALAEAHTPSRPPPLPRRPVTGGVPRGQILELLKRHDFHYKEGDTLAFPPAPKWRPEHRDKL